jgi:hypothetical protein
MDDKVMIMRIALRVEEVRKKHIDRGCQVCCDREQFNDENDEKEVN